MSVLVESILGDVPPGLHKTPEEWANEIVVNPRFRGLFRGWQGDRELLIELIAEIQQDLLDDIPAPRDNQHN